ncbi:MAG: hypothetical protein JWP12_2004 [Bacteroidetes bacterium]|nr:hypothetical protein [Bacteroidota bacterium]
MAKNVNQSLVKRTTPPPPTPIPTGGFEVSLILMLGDEEVILNGRSLKGGVKVEYVRHWEEAIQLGSFLDGLGLVGGAIGVTTLAADVTTFIKGLPPFLGKIADSLVTAQLILTDLTIDTTGTAKDPDDDKGAAKNHYILGVGLNFVKPVEAGNVKLKAFLIKYECYTVYVPTPPPTN